MVERKPTFIVAEAGINANADTLIAISMVNAAFIAGADAIKFQLWESNRFPDLEYYRFSSEQMVKIKEYADLFNIKWFCTPFDFESIDFLASLGMDIWKVPSGMVTNYEYLHKMAQQKGRFILSTGMCELDEIEMAFDYTLSDKDDVVVLQCISIYPCAINEINLQAMIKLNWWGKYGLSDHTPGIEIPIAAVALGASVIEKHFTLDRNMPGPDQKMSLEPDEFRAMVKAIRNVELAMGDGIKRPTPSEVKVRDKIRERMAL